ncbi:DUF7669 domain-containing protein [Tepidibacter formicigenes]|uniref:DUF7669 domain-containing protein n=1 Tax=Tepidibacter formicigenes DSM 15518 TaxID=1123349 RepID=A0A1M6QQ12_9FIRM|nr:hypothetical protein [Tepidibacter formicigenes]SHK22228.1 hypothetical protein SAMN02744037_01912 [Tepidibacter formicigenes DSM 15518]
MISKIIMKYYSLLNEEKHQRYKSWEHCYKFFRKHKEFLTEEQKDHAALHLAFYLASWGMYRGSSFLLQKDYKVHKYAIDVLLDSKYDLLWDMDLSNYKLHNKYSELLFKLKSELTNSYRKNIKYINGEEKDINITDTLSTKILLGTIGCIPAYDRYFVEGLKFHGFKYRKFNQNSFKELIDFYNLFKDEFNRLKIKTESDGLEYPEMKLIYMYFWQVGYLLDESNKISSNDLEIIKNNSLEFKNELNKKNTPIINEKDVIKNKSYKIPVWKMVKEAVEHMDGEFTKQEIKDYIFETYGEVNEGTIDCQILIASVNRNSRVNWYVNKKERISNGKYDFIYDREDGYLEKYYPDRHGMWEIKRIDGKYCVKKC